MPSCVSFLLPLSIIMIQYGDLISCFQIVPISGRGRTRCLSISSQKVGIILVDHGSRRKEANDMLMKVSENYKQFSNFTIVEAAHMELAKPSISDAFTKCVDSGANHIICHPFFLSYGRHVTQDIPQLMKEAAKPHAGISYTISNPLGIQKEIVSLIHTSISETL
mmetsp:Transcript_20446/g.20564  ORF Transcript_20446/g.20564 Transcript_20446/m.20564 type:complete len:165 (+) Transcript_20446:128-622(+)